VNEILHADGGAIRGEIDDAEQAREYEREWRQLVSGLPPAKTSEVIRALLLYARIGGARCQLYLYDAPGEEFSSIASMSRQQYVPLLDGFILLVDPMSFEGVHVGAKRTVSRGMPLQEVVTSILMTAASGAPVGPNGQLRPRLAVVVSKADLDLVREAVGDRPSREACRQAIVRWAGENALRAVEHRFASVGYFACSPLGRSVDAQRGQPFRGSGVLEPLLWVLTGVRA
jgi:hypothetical protein